MKILIIGGGGMLGHKLIDVLSKNFEVWTTLKSEIEKYENYKFLDREKTICNLNIANTDLLEKVIKEISPDVIINSVGIIKQLPNSNDIINTLTINSIFPHRLAEISRKYNSYLINVSTDCVFNGSNGNYAETDIADAYDLYGKSKNLGEVVAENCLTIRTSIIGRELNTKHSLVEWFLNNQGKQIKGFVNAVFSGFPTVIFAGIINELIIRNNRLEGLYHISSEPINKFDLLTLLKDEYEIDIEIVPFEDFKVDRSLNSDKFRKTVGFHPKKWKEMVGEMVNDPFGYEKYK